MTKPLQPKMRILILTLYSLLPALAAQRTWIVDAAGGPGVDFIDLPPAVAAATSGDSIRIRPAATDYREATIDKGLRIVATGPGVFVTGVLLVQNVRASEMCVLQGLCHRAPGYLWVSACGGSVIVRELAASPVPGTGCAVVVIGSAAVRLESCWIEAGRGAGLIVSDSSVQCVDCVIRGLDLIPYPSMPLPPSGIQAVQSTLVLVHTAVFGGRVLSTAGAQAPAIDVPMAGGRTVLTAGSTLVGGGSVAFRGAGTDLVLDTPAALVGSVAGNVRTTTSQVPALDAETSRGLDLRYHGLPGDLMVLALSWSTNPIATPFGSQWLDIASALVVDVGVAVNGSRTVPLTPVLNLPGANLAAQALVLRGSSLAWSTPLAIVTP